VIDVGRDNHSTAPLPLESAQVGDFPLGDVVHFFSNNTLGIVHLGYIALAMTLGDPFSPHY